MIKPASKIRSSVVRWSGIAVLTVVIVFGVCEVLGWPFLAAPIQGRLETMLKRPVSFAPDAGGAPSLRLRFLGGLHVWAEHLKIAAPSWSQAPYMIRARDADIRLRYIDLWRAYRGGAMRIERVTAAELDGTIERLADGRASWEFGDGAPKAPGKAAPVPIFGAVHIGSGGLAYRDALIQLDLDSRFSLTDSSTPNSVSNPSSGVPAPAGAASKGSSLNVTAHGTYRKNVVVTMEGKTIGVLPLLGDGAAQIALPVTLSVKVGNAEAVFEGTATDALNLGRLSGRFRVDGPSLAAIGDPLGVTLPTTPSFSTHGLIRKEGTVWNAVFEQAKIGSSALTGAFTYDTGRTKPLLSGRLNASRLLLADLGPAVGAPARSGTEKKPAPSQKQKPSNRAAGKVLPDRPFDLPSLRAMDANVLVDIANLDSGSDILQPLRPLRTHLLLQDGVLALRDIDARTAQGRLTGSLQLDGRNKAALWNADLGWSDVRLESLIHQTRSQGAPPYLTGKMNGRATLAGEGASTAAILGSLKGGVRVYVVGGSISHLIVEGSGLDVAQALGVFVKGDNALPMECVVGDFVADKGLFRPRVMVVDTGDSTVWVDGSVSLASEAMDLRLVVDPKDFSPLALRSPIHVKGTLGDPSVSIEKRPLITRAGAAVALALINPLAAVLPLLDFGSSDEAKQGDVKCRALMQRKISQPPVSPQAAGKVAERVAKRASR